MADFARVGLAAEIALGWPAGSFLEAYEANQEAVVAAAVDADPLVQRLLAWAKQQGTRGEAQKTPSEWLDALTVGVASARETGLPTRANHLSGRLFRAEGILRRRGIDLERGKRSDGERFIAVCWRFPGGQDDGDDDFSPTPSIKGTL